MLQNYNSRALVGKLRQFGRLMLQLAHIMIIVCELNMPDQSVEKKLD